MIVEWCGDWKYRHCSGKKEEMVELRAGDTRGAGG